MNANFDLLKHIIEDYPDYECDLSRFSYDKNPALHLALSLAGFAKYR